MSTGPTAHSPPTSPSTRSASTARSASTTSSGVWTPTTPTPGARRSPGRSSGPTPPRDAAPLHTLGPPGHAHRGNGAELLEKHLVDRELGEPDPLDQPIRQVASPAGPHVASVPEEI